MEILLAGFGGQGILFAGKFLTYIGLQLGKEVSWLPSYGPEMRGGTANCGVILSDQPVGSPIVLRPKVLVALNLPSLDKFENAVVPGGKIFWDTTMAARPVSREDVEKFPIPASGMAGDEGLQGLANMIITGHLIRHTGLCESAQWEAAMKKTIPERKQALFSANLKAINLGYAYDASRG